MGLILFLSFWGLLAAVGIVWSYIQLYKDSNHKSDRLQT